MVLRCSLLGHNYGEPEVDREREERGSEVVLTVTEFQACQRCGERNVISENTEVTSIVPGDRAARSPDEPAEPDEHRPSVGESTGQEPPSGGEAPAREREPTAASNAVGSADGQAASSESDSTARAHAAGGETGATAAEDDEELEVPTDENGDPIVDDGEILEDEPTDSSAGDRRHGEWPDSEDVGPPVETSDEPPAWPEDEQADDDVDTDDRTAEVETQPEDDAVILENDSDATSASTSETDKQFDYSVSATGESEASGTGSEAVTGVDATASTGERESAAAESTRPETGIASAQSAPVPGESSPTDGANTEFYCPQCTFVAPGDSGSLRTGDICPECKKGYLGERNA